MGLQNPYCRAQNALFPEIFIKMRILARKSRKMRVKSPVFGSIFAEIGLFLGISVDIIPMIEYNRLRRA